MVNQSLNQGVASGVGFRGLWVYGLERRGSSGREWSSQNIFMVVVAR